MIEFSRHDNHNVELKSSIPRSDKRHESRLNLYLFMPKSMQLSSYPKTSLVHDFSSRVRMALQEREDRDSGPHTRLSSEIDRLDALIAQGAGSDDGEVFARVRHLGAMTSERLKHATASHSRELFLAHSLLSTPANCVAEVERIRERAAEIAVLVRDLHDAVHRLGLDGRAPVVGLLDQFMHDLVIEYLSVMTRQLDFVSTLSDRFGGERYDAAIQRLRDTLSSMVRDEAARRQGHAGEDPAGQNPDQRLYRAGQLKKFFQSEMFVDVAKHDSARKLSEPAAILGATVSAGCALFLEDAIKHGKLFIRLFMGFGGVSVALAGIFMYVFKDRLKDRGKTYFFKKMGRFISDFDQDLLLKRRKIGRVREHFGVKPKDSLPEPVKALRDRHAMTEAERFVGEEILSFSRHLDLQPEGQEALGASVREVWRLNLARYLKHMDDTYKDVPALTETGELTMIRSHRLYYFHAVISHASATVERQWPGLRLGSATSATPVFRIYRVAMDKKGIQGIEELEVEA